MTAAAGAVGKGFCIPVQQPSRPLGRRFESCLAQCAQVGTHSQPCTPQQSACVLTPALQIMHVLVAAAMWQLHLGATADYHTVTDLLSGAAHCPS